jgi:DNA repair protein RecO (recombination protein O)
MVIILCENSGLIQTFLKKDKKIVQPQIYDFLNVRFDYRGSYSYRNLEVEVLESYWKNIFSDELLINIFNSMASVLNLTLRERGDVGILYRLYKNLLFLTDFGCDSIVYYYIDFLLNVLKLFGINIDTSRCSVSGSTNGICYISPKTGNCVTAAVGEKYRHSLFLVPRSFQYYSEDVSDIIDAIDILHYFLLKIFVENGIVAEFGIVEMFKKTIGDNLRRKYQKT